MKFTREMMLGNKYGFKKGNIPWNKGLKGLRLSPTLPPVMRGRDNPTWVEPIKRECENCKAVFYRKPWEIRRRRGRFCSPKCRNEYYSKSGQLLHMCKMAHKAPTNPERRFIDICSRFDLPFRFVGDRSFWVGKTNPDFIWESAKIAVEIMNDYHHNFFKLFEEGKTLPWFKTPVGRREYLAAKGWRCITLPDNFREADALKEVLKYCPLQRNLLIAA